MSGPMFVTCPGCERLMLGQVTEDEFTGERIGVVTQPHECPGATS